MDLSKLASEVLGAKLGGQVDVDKLVPALGKMLSGNSGNLDLGALVSMMQGKGLGGMADSWLGDGDNDPISRDQMRDVLGGDKVKDLAREVDADEDSLLDGLTNALPGLVDKSSRGGSLLDAKDLIGMAGKLFR